MGSGKRFIIFLAFLTLIGVATACAEQATVFDFSGDAKIVPKGRKIGVDCEKGMVVYPGDWVKTGSGSFVTIAFDDKNDNVIKVEENSLVIIKLDGYFKLQLLSGEIYAILENVEANETFRVLTPSVVTEATSSGWGAKSDGNLTNVVVFDDRIFICGINKDGSVNKKRYWIEEGYERSTKKFEEPGELKPAPDNMVSWFKDQVVAHHLDKMMAKQLKEQGIDPAAQGKAGEGAQPGEAPKPGPGKGTVIIDGEEVNLVEYLYRQRLNR
ncbi:MAG: FecR family protein [Candidatus Omnitrophica bacterium]|nr:FecR family protein [Candidatus Omnitrophota bacterium]MDD5487562.1 FecR family protein [Candidatus Omnitrophota bacterium]